MQKLFAMIKRSAALNSAFGRAKKTVIIIVVTVLAIALYAHFYANHIVRGLASNIIRLHVVANSDSPVDQSLKIEVRDAVLSYMENELGKVEDVGKVNSFINGNMDKIAAAARKALLDNGEDYPVDMLMGNFLFPEKNYGNITLPAGNYQALKVVIGEGVGANWWCVIFPPLCFVDATHGEIPDSVRAELREVLTEDEYGMIATADESVEVPIKIKLKIVEMFKSSGIKLAGIVSRFLKLAAQ